MYLHSTVMSKYFNCVQWLEEHVDSSEAVAPSAGVNLSLIPSA